MRRFQRLLWVSLIFIISGCASGAVQFAPTPLPPDLSPIRYQHPGNAFSISVPRNWSVYEQNSATLASTSFSLPGFNNPSLTVSVINLGDPVETTQIIQLIEEYQTAHRPDLTRYREQERSALGDGSWHISGVRTITGGAVQQTNTFIEMTGSFMSVMEVVIPTSAPTMSELQTAVNTLSVNTEAPLQPAGLSTFSFVRSTEIEVLNIGTWTNDSGVFFITGEIANHSDKTIQGVPVRVTVLDAEDNVLLDAADISMGHGIPAGGFAPFSLRFGQGQPATAENYHIRTTESEIMEASQPIVNGSVLQWEESSSFTDTGDLRISGSVTNNGATAVRDLLALITVFDVNQNVIGAWFSPIRTEPLPQGETFAFEVNVLELGGDPVNYIVEIQGIGDS